MVEYNLENSRQAFKECDKEYFYGKFENDFLDAKLEPINCDRNDGKSKFLRDVATYANLNGGIIVLGFKTEKPLTNPFEKITNIEPFNTDKVVDNKTYQELVRDNIYPYIKIEVEYKQIENNKYIGMIFIPKLDKSSWPFLIKYSRSGYDTDKYSGAIFTYLERRGDQNSPVNYANIHKYMRDGLLFEKNIENRFNSLDVQLSEFRKDKSQKERGVIYTDDEKEKRFSINLKFNDEQ